MGTTAEKLSYLNGTKRLLRRRLNSLGANITLDTKFRDYLLWLNRFYDAASSSVKFEILGETTQEQYDASYNLLPNNIQSQTINGVTITRNEDGSLTLNGTSTDTFGLNFIDNFELEAGTYYFNFFESYPLPFTYYVYYETSSTTYTVSYNKTNTFESDVVGTVRLAIQNGVTFDNLKVYPLIAEGSTAKEYKPYGAKPSPYNPSEIINKTGEITYTASDGTIFPIDLGNIELCYNPGVNYDCIVFENGVFHLRKITYQYTFDEENRDWSHQSQYNGLYYTIFYVTNNYALSNYYENVRNSNIVDIASADSNLSNGQFAIGTTVNARYIFVKNTNLTETGDDVTQFLNWLSTHNLTVQYQDSSGIYMEEINKYTYPELYNQLQAIIDYETKLQIEKKIF